MTLPLTKGSGGAIYCVAQKWGMNWGGAARNNYWIELVTIQQPWKAFNSHPIPSLYRFIDSRLEDWGVERIYNLLGVMHLIHGGSKGFPGGEQWQRTCLLTQETPEMRDWSLGWEDPLEEEMVTPLFPLQHSCLGNPMDRGAWKATVHEVTESWTQLREHGKDSDSGSLTTPPQPQRGHSALRVHTLKLTLSLTRILGCQLSGSRAIKSMFPSHES